MEPRRLSGSAVPSSSSSSFMGTNNSSSDHGLSQPRKRVALHGIPTSFEDKSSDFLCPICFELIREAHITKCGHTYCYSCIVKAIETNKRCPHCSTVISNIDQIFPNFLLNDLILKYKNKIALKTSTHVKDNLKELISSETKNLTLPDVNIMLEILNQRKQLLEAESCISQNKMLHDFLRLLLEKKENEMVQIGKEINLIKNDLDEVEQVFKEIQSNCPNIEEIKNSIANEQNERVLSVKREIIDLMDTIESTNEIADKEDGFNASQPNEMYAVILQNRKKRIRAYFDDFVSYYFELRSEDLYLHVDPSDRVETDDDGGGSQKTGTDDEKCQQMESMDSTDTMPALSRRARLPNTKKALDEFRESLVKFSRFNSLRPLATLNFDSDLLNISSIVSTIGFDKDQEYFAISGVTRRIKIFDYHAVIRDVIDIHYPSVELVSSSKISCVCWNSYYKGILASSDYEGEVTIWDAEVGKKTKSFTEHDKRCWSVDFNNVDARLIASGSDDTRVKLWSLNTENSIASIDVKANVCCVKFNPKSSCHLAFGSADHCVYYYDLRHTKQPLFVYKGHKKAVSYVQFLNTNEIISASTDSQLKLWNINSPITTLRSFEGRINKTHFVGLATDGDYIASGSENNSLYIYYKELPRPLFTLKFNDKYVLDAETGNNPSDFVSAVCWRKNSNVIVAANSRGIIEILEFI